MPSLKDSQSPKHKENCFLRILTTFVTCVFITIILVTVFGCEKFNFGGQKNATNCCLETCEAAEIVGNKSADGTTKPLANTELQTTFNGVEKEFETNKQKEVESMPQELCQLKLKQVEEEYGAFTKHPTINPISTKYSAYLDRCSNKQCEIRYKNMRILQSSFNSFLEAIKRDEHIDEKSLKYCPKLLRMCD